MIQLQLPVPVSQPMTKFEHHMARARARNKYKKDAWVKAIQQHVPRLDPPRHVRIDAHFSLHQLRDPADNLPNSLKWVMDCLKQVQRGAVNWRYHAGAGLYVKAGYFIDDDPRYVERGSITQERIGRTEPELVTVTITPLRGHG